MANSKDIHEWSRARRAAALAGAAVIAAGTAGAVATPVNANPPRAAVIAAAAQPTPTELTNLTAYENQVRKRAKAHKKSTRGAVSNISSTWPTLRSTVVAAGAGSLASSYDRHVSKLKKLVSKTSPSWSKVTSEASTGLDLLTQIKTAIG